MDSQVTTGRGDAGYTTALDGGSYSKSHVIMECVGTVDELRTVLALARLNVMWDDPEVGDFLFWLLHVCFVIGSACSDPENRHPDLHPYRIGAREIQRIEREQARMEAAVKLPKRFIVSAATQPAALADIACTVARRMERNLVRLRETEPKFSDPDMFVFVNRLSDCLYILARFLDEGKYQAADYSVLDTQELDAPER